MKIFIFPWIDYLVQGSASSGGVAVIAASRQKALNLIKKETSTLKHKYGGDAERSFHFFPSPEEIASCKEYELAGNPKPEVYVFSNGFTYPS